VIRTFNIVVLHLALATSFGAVNAYTNPRHKDSAAKVKGVKSIKKVRNHASYSELRHEILGIIGGATKKIWLVTPYLTDGEIATSLFMAKYRKLDVKVLLGRKNANKYLSRLGFLKRQNVPVFLAPEGFGFVDSTAILSDDRLVLVNGSLNFKASKFKFVSKEGTNQQVEQFEKQFKAATAKQIPAIPRPTPYVGRPGRYTNIYRPGTKVKSHKEQDKNRSGTSGSVTRSYSRQPSLGAQNPDGSYNYNRKRPDKSGPGMPNRLPKETIQQKKLKEQFRKNR